MGTATSTILDANRNDSIDDKVIRDQPFSMFHEGQSNRINVLACWWGTVAD